MVAVRGEPTTWTGMLAHLQWVLDLDAAMSALLGRPIRVNENDMTTVLFSVSFECCDSLVPRHCSDVPTVLVLLHHRGHIQVLEKHRAVFPCVPMSEFLAVVLAAVVQTFVSACERLSGLVPVL